MISILLEVILPVYLIAATGIILGKFKSIDIKSISASVFYLFSTALIFRSLSQSTVSDDIALKVILATWGLFFLGFIYARIWSKIRSKEHDEKTRASFSLSITTINAGSRHLYKPNFVKNSIDIGFKNSKNIFIRYDFYYNS